MTVEMKIVTPFTREEEIFLSDIITTAVEGGTGYWASVSDYEWVMEGESGWKPTTVILYDQEEDPDAPLALNIEKVANGINMLIAGYPTRYVTDYTLKGLAALDAGEIDSDAADAIVQCALLGEIVYG